MTKGVLQAIYAADTKKCAFDYEENKKLNFTTHIIAKMRYKISFCLFYVACVIQNQYCNTLLKSVSLSL